MWIFRVYGYFGLRIMREIGYWNLLMIVFVQDLLFFVRICF